MGLLLLMGDSGFRGALDTLTTGLSSVWSTARRTRTAYSKLDPIVRIRRDSDSTESDFAGDSNGIVSADAIAAFCGAGGGFYRTIYDQSGLGRHFEQTSTSIQPIACESGVPVTVGGRLAAKFVEADLRRMAVTGSTAFYNALHTTGGTIASVLTVDDTATTKVFLGNSSGTNQAGFQVIFTTGEALLSRVSRLDVAGTPTSGNSVSSTHNSFGTSNSVAVCVLDPDNATAADRSLLWRNGTSIAGNNAATGTPLVENAANNLTLGASTVSLSGFDGTFQELAIWSNIISTANRDFYESNAGSFYGITVA